MPELPEVEDARLRVLRALRGRRISGVNTRPDPIVFDGTSPRQIASSLRGARVLSAGRKGKHFWLELDRRPWPLFHFGMSGNIKVYQEVGERPGYWKLELVAENGTRVGWINKRRLGRIRLRQDPRYEPPVSLLGFDALEEIPSPPDLYRMVHSRKAPIKALLLDQSFSAGVGNWIADEVLFQAGVAPHRRAQTLTPLETRRLGRVLGRVIRHAVKVGADDDRFPPSWLFHHRWRKKKGARTSRGHRLRFSTVGGRTTAWVPEVQR